MRGGRGRLFLPLDVALIDPRRVEMGGKRIMLVGVLGALAVGLAAGSAFGSGPAEREIVPVIGDQFVCEGATYTITSGSIQIVSHFGESASGNLNFTFTITPLNVVAEDGEGNVVREGGAGPRGAGSFNAQQGTGVSTFTFKIQFVQQGSGTVDSLNVTFHVTTVNGAVKDFDFGTCELPEGG
jgi:hypothetical protein